MTHSSSLTVRYLRWIASVFGVSSSFTLLVWRSHHSMYFKPQMWKFLPYFWRSRSVLFIFVTLIVLLFICEPIFTFGLFVAFCRDPVTVTWLISKSHVLYMTAQSAFSKYNLKLYIHKRNIIKCIFNATASSCYPSYMLRDAQCHSTHFRWVQGVMSLPTLDLQKNAAGSCCVFMWYCCLQQFKIHVPRKEEKDLWHHQARP